VTVPMPLEAIHDIIGQAIAKNPAKLPILSTEMLCPNMVYVTKEFFQSPRSGVSPDNVKEDLLGFLSLVMSYAKAADILDEDTSPKMMTCIMPRTDFTSMFHEVGSQLQGANLYDLVKVLSCYKNAPLGNGPVEYVFKWLF
jgi:hypothetical protein